MLPKKDLTSSNICILALFSEATIWKLIETDQPILFLTLFDIVT